MRISDWSSDVCSSDLSACAQEAPASGEAPPPVADPAVALGQALAGTVYTPADFTRYAPKTALDMLNQVPGFSIRENDTVRGLGQATGNVLFNGARPSTKSDTIVRSEEHTSELQSLMRISYAVFCL